MPIRDGAACPGCGLPNYSGLCPVCRGDESAYIEELHPHFGDFYPGQTDPGPDTVESTGEDRQP